MSKKVPYVELPYGSIVKDRFGNIGIKEYQTDYPLWISTGNGADNPFDDNEEVEVIDLPAILEELQQLRDVVHDVAQDNVVMIEEGARLERAAIADEVVKTRGTRPKGIVRADSFDAGYDGALDNVEYRLSNRKSVLPPLPPLALARRLQELEEENELLKNRLARVEAEWEEWNRVYNDDYPSSENLPAPVPNWPRS